jgi:hypothetical protein
MNHHIAVRIGVSAPGIVQVFQRRSLVLDSSGFIYADRAGGQRYDKQQDAADD